MKIRFDVRHYPAIGVGFYWGEYTISNVETYKRFSIDVDLLFVSITLDFKWRCK